jgi:hypothetical protein
MISPCHQFANVTCWVRLVPRPGWRGARRPSLRHNTMTHRILAQWLALTLPQRQLQRVLMDCSRFSEHTVIISLHSVNRRPPLRSSGQSSWLQIRRHGFDSWHYQKKCSGSGTGFTQPREYNWGATWQKSSGSCLENREYGRRDPSHWPRGTLYPQKLAITSPTSGGRSVGIVRSRTQTMEFVFVSSVNRLVLVIERSAYSIAGFTDLVHRPKF